MNKSVENSQTSSFLGRSYLSEFQRKLLQRSLKDDLSEAHRQRILIMLMADEGKTQKEIIATLKCSAATARYWTTMARTGLAHQWEEISVGRPKRINQEYLERLKDLVSHNPKDYGYSFQRWTGLWLSRQLAKEFSIDVNERHINRLLKEMGLSTTKKTNVVVEEHSSFRIAIHDLPKCTKSKNDGILV